MTRRRFNTVLIATILVAQTIDRSAWAANLPAGFQETTVLGGISLNAAAAVRFAPDGRVFIAERSGIIKVFDDVDDSTPTVFADLTTEVYNAWDRGLLGLALHPDFPTTPYIYALYTRDAPVGGTAPVWNDQCPDPPGFTNQGCVVSSRLVRLEAAGDVMIGAPTVLLDGWCQQYPSHSVGDLRFGPSGALYASHGDGASFSFEDFGQVGNPCGDPPLEGGSLRSQDVAAPGDPLDYHGTIIRVDPLTGNALPDNPLFGGADSDDDRLIAYGLRNPFRFTIRPGTEELWIGDVGWGAWEDIERVIDPVDAVVDNFGWPCYEGPARQPGFDSADLPICEALYAAGTALPPYHAYPHDGPTGNAITGLAFYEGTGNYPAAYQGALFFTDFSAAWIKVMFADGSDDPDPANILTFSTAVSPVDLQIGPGGDLYYLNYSYGGPSYLRRVRYFEINTPPVAIAEADVTSGPAPLVVAFVGSNSFDPDPADTIGFAWDLDGDGVFDDSDQPNTSFVYDVGGVTVVRLRVTDNIGQSSIDSVVIAVDNAPPVPVIVDPTVDTTWRVGDLISFQGFAVDPDTGPVPPQQLLWEFVLHHCEEPSGPGLRHDDEFECHEHFLVATNGVSGGVFGAVDHEYPSFLEVVFTATDAGQPDWWNTSWTRRQRLVLENSANPNDLDDFPLLVRLDPTRVDYAFTAPAGADLRFVDADGTVLPHEIEQWDPAGDTLVWVRVPRIDGGSSSDFLWLYYGNPGAADAQDPTGVWTDDYAAVWHLTDAATSGPPSPAPDPVLQNPGFELGLDGWIGDGSVYVEGIDPRSGAAHLKMFGRFTGAANTSFVYQDWPATPDQAWSLHCFAEHITGDALTDTANYAEMRIEFLDAAAGILASGGTVILDSASATDAWQNPQAVVLIAPAGTVTARARLVFAQPTGSEAGAAFYDDVTFGVTTAPAYDVLDATFNDNDGLSDSAPAAPGRVAGARVFTGTSHVDAGSKPSLMLTNELTLAAWIRVDDPDVDAYMRIISKKNTWNGPAGYELEYNPGQNFLTVLGSGGDFARASGVDLDTGWHHVAATIGADQGAVYVDGVDRTTDASVTPLAASPQALRLGMSSNGGSGFDGAIDEVRIERVARPAAWIATDYASMTDALVTYGTAETLTPLAASTCIEIDPETSILTLLAVPPVLDLTVNGVQAASPVEQELIVFAQTVVSAPTPQTVGGVEFEFASWSDGGAQVHNIVAPESDSTLTAVFVSTDLAALANCLTGPNRAPVPDPPVTPTGCVLAFDHDDDGDVDLADFAVFTTQTAGD